MANKDIEFYLQFIDGKENDLSEKIKLDFFQDAVVSILQYGWSTWTQTKHKEKAR